MLLREVEILEIRPYLSNSMEAFIDVRIDFFVVRIDFFVVYGSKIMKKESGEKWLAWPSVERDGKYFDTIGIDSRTAEKQIKTEIIRQYKEKTGALDDIFGTERPTAAFGFIEDAQPNAM